MVPGLAALTGASLGAGSGFLPRKSLVTAVWATWAGVAGGLALSQILSGELLNAGTPGVIMACLGAFLAALLTSHVLDSLAVEGDASPERATAPGGPVDDGQGVAAPPRHRVARQVGTVVAVVALVATLAALGLGLLALVLLLVVAAVVLAHRGWPLAPAAFIVVAISSASVVILGKLVLSPLGLVGEAVPTVLAAAVVLVPLLVSVTEKDVWRSLPARVGLLDVAAFAVAAAAALSWWNLFAGLGRHQVAAQLVRLGEDNDAQLLMLVVTEKTDAALGATPESAAMTALFSTYFPGGSLWQSSLGAFLSPMSTPELYALSTAVLLGLLAGSATSLAAMFAARSSGLAALAAVGIGVVGARLALAQFELGFPGQLLTTGWIVVGLLVVVRTLSGAQQMLRAAAVLLVLALASWWTWSLTAPLLLLPVVALVAGALHQRLRPSRRTLVALGGVLVVLSLSGAFLVRDRIFTALEELNLDGPVFRAVPIWFAYLLVIAFPAAVLVNRQRLTWRATFLVLGTAAATLGLATWQLARVGVVNYYSYKLEYLLLALGWAAVAMLVPSILARREQHHRWLRFVGPPLLLLSIPMLLSVSSSYEGWLGERGALGPDMALSCASAEAASAQTGTPVIGVGFGDPTADYLASKFLIVSAGNDESYPFWRPQLTRTDPAAWPWPVNESVFIIEGPAAEAGQTQAVVDAARTAGSSPVLTRDCA